MRRKARAPMPDHRADWQREQAARCGCKGTDDLCPCQNENPWPRPKRSRVEPSPGVEKNKPPCVAEVRLSASETTTRAQREWRARRAGLEPAVCGRRGVYLVDGRALCLAHAGLAALCILACEEVT